MYTPEFIKRVNQYTKGLQFMLEGEEYIGYYNMTAVGPYTGRVYSPATSEKLQIFREASSPLAVEYLALIEETGHISDFSHEDPVYGVQMPVYPDDYKIGWFYRYFIKQRNNNTARVIEISKSEFEDIPGIGAGLNSSFYQGIQVRWKLTGPKNDIKNSRGVIIEPGIEDTNFRVLQQRNIQMPGLFGTHGKNLLRHTEYDDLASQNIDLPNLNSPNKL
tara:strand:- start:721 stop:1377 length:657 start_codon:yes stop_codon:yes gene_type:complete